ncbi:MAG TPA: PepSY-associated TM helix domain-containing protein [Bryobacteraceae bacterium]|nr:PepSY-associated TM helix domain-containing protein [Bryobacteraceae bacterium]
MALPATTDKPKATPSRRSFWARQITLWHWVSSGICLIGMLLFTVTGITLNHAAAIPSTPVVTQTAAVVPEPLRAQLQAGPVDGKQPLPPALAEWVHAQFGATTPTAAAEWSEEEVYISLPRPGGDGWASIQRKTGQTKYEKTDRGWISYLNDLHKGRHTGTAWMVFIDVVAAACLVFTISGLLLLQLHAAKRPSTWPLVAAGLVIPVLLMLLLVHR